MFENKIHFNMCFQAQNMINLSILWEVKNYALFDYIKQYVRCLKDLRHVYCIKYYTRIF